MLGVKWVQQQSNRETWKTKKKSHTDRSPTKRSRDRSGLYEGKRHLTTKAFPTLRRLSHCNENTHSQQPSRRVGILATQSVVQNEVSKQSMARRVQDRAETDWKSAWVHMCMSVSREFLFVTRGWGKTAWLQFQAKTGKQLLKGGEDKEGGRREGLSEEHAQSLFQAVLNHPLSQRCTDCAPVEEKTVERNVGWHAQFSHIRRLMGHFWFAKLDKHYWASQRGHV